MHVAGKTALQNVDTGPWLGAMCRGKRADPDNSALSPRIVRNQAFFVRDLLPLARYISEGAGIRVQCLDLAR
jgi:hypothetical protein